MYISTATKLKTLGICWAISCSLIYYLMGLSENVFNMALVVGSMFTLPCYLFLGWFINPIIQKSEDEKNQKDQEKRYKKENEEYQRREAENYQEQLRRDMERKRLELEIEFEHYSKIAMLNASIDHSKMEKIEQIKQEFENNKRGDLENLNAQIQRMKQEL